LTGTRVIFHSI